MKTVTIEKAVRNLDAMIEDALNSHEEINIATDRGAVVMIPQEDYEAMRETLRLLEDKKSLQALLESHWLRDQGEIPEGYSVEDVFSDLQD
jgi:PHD/YefM family antitoxin component YafN of YafNO toxin-antitoxin module